MRIPRPAVVASSQWQRSPSAPSSRRRCTPPGSRRTCRPGSAAPRRPGRRPSVMHRSAVRGRDGSGPTLSRPRRSGSRGSNGRVRPRRRGEGHRRPRAGRSGSPADRRGVDGLGPDHRRLTRPRSGDAGRWPAPPTTRVSRASPEHRARVTGTPRDPDVRVSAFVDLVVDTHGARLVPVAPATGPAGFPRR